MIEFPIEFPVKPSWSSDSVIGRYRPKGFFPGACGACCPQSWYLRRFDADSSLGMLSQYDAAVTGTDIVFRNSQAYTYSEVSSVITVRKHDGTTLSLGGSVSPTYNTAAGFNAYCFDLDSADNIIVTAVRTAAITTRKAIASYTIGGSLNWETSLDAVNAAFQTITNHFIASLAVDVSSNDVYFSWSGDTAGVTVCYLTKLNSSGTKQWTTAYVSTALKARGPVAITSGGSVWVSGGVGASELYLFSSSGTITLVVTDISGGAIPNALSVDSSEGVWALTSTPSSVSARLHHCTIGGTKDYDFADTDFDGYNGEPLRLIGIDGSDNLFGVIKSSGLAKVRKWNSSATVQWTSPSTGWNVSGGKNPFGIQIDGAYAILTGHQTP